MSLERRILRDERVWERWTWLLIAVGLVILHGLTFRFVIDDAYISYRFAQNLLDGHGLVFNPGQPVEGYSNLLWVLLSAAGMKLGLPALLWGRILGTASIAGLLMLLPAVLRRLAPEHAGRNPWPGRVAQLGAAACGPIACWMLAGLETPLFALLVVAAWCAALHRNPIAAGALGVLLILTRPEGPAFALIFLVWSLLPEAGALTDARRRLVDRWPGPTILLAGAAAFFLWRHATYGLWLPNTYYAKTGDLAGQLATGLPYGADFLLWFGLPLLGLGLLAGLRCGFVLLQSREMVLTLLTLLFWASYVVLIGGDTLGMFRFFVPVLAVLIAWIAAWMSAAGWLHSGLPSVLLAIVLGAAILPASHWGKERWLAATHMREANLGGWMLAGDAMARQLPSDSTIALGPAGYIPWKTGFRTLDYFGIVTPEIAHREMAFEQGFAGHQKHDGGWIVAQQPDYILIGNVDITAQPRQGLIPPLEVEKEIVLDKGFQGSYRMRSLQLANGKYLNLFERIEPAP